MKIKRLHESAVIPKYATPGAGAFDLVQAWAECECGKVVIHTGLSVEIPPGRIGVIVPRSGLGTKHGVRLLNTVGIIDSDYRGEVMVMVGAAGYMRAGLKDGMRVAQMAIMPVERVEFEEVDELSNTERGDGGFGHTGV